MTAKGIEYTCRVTPDGRLPGATRQALAGILSGLAGKQVQVRVKPFKKKRSQPQNAFYFGVVVPLVRQMFTDAGNSISLDETHEFIKEHVWKHLKQVTLPDGEVMEVPDTSTNLCTMDWEVNIEKTRAWAAQFGLEIPFPNEGAYAPA